MNDNRGSESYINQCDITNKTIRKLTELEKESVDELSKEMLELIEDGGQMDEI